VITGTLDDVLGDARHEVYADHFLSVTLTDASRVDDAMSRLQRRFPHAVHLDWQPAVDPAAAATSYRERVAGKDTLEITRDFVAHARGSAATRTEHALLSDVVERQLRSADETLELAADDAVGPLAEIA
jgi:exonuclease SbcD